MRVWVFSRSNRNARRQKLASEPGKVAAALAPRKKQGDAYINGQAQRAQNPSIPCLPEPVLGAGTKVLLCGAGPSEKFLHEQRGEEPPLRSKRRNRISDWTHFTAASAGEAIFPCLSQWLYLKPSASSSQALATSEPCPSREHGEASRANTDHQAGCGAHDAFTWSRALTSCPFTSEHLARKHLNDILNPRLGQPRSEKPH